MSCPGWYCGKTRSPDGNFSDCGPCSRGYRRNDISFICEQCMDTPTFYDWLYLGFVVLLVLILHCFFIDMVSMRRSFSKDVIILHTTAFMEVLLSCILSLLLSYPMGYLSIRSCRVRTLSDWYTLLHNPTPNYENKIHCTQEAVYPLYTIVFKFYGLSLILMLLIRPWVCRKISSSSKQNVDLCSNVFYSDFGIVTCRCRRTIILCLSISGSYIVGNIMCSPFCNKNGPKHLVANPQNSDGTP
ncbi:hypothetical protein NQ315_007209 [Exocentrus adspersus]|uniref:JNK1/MAPK8-associated membrane protein n=1 Tax=Exocentrus adspersus TaxID=1586481 RepID=A0AAV8WCS2_9CUCU|nr:hypothetical protein NQ315_007209 [Exocentrus adspersus]